MNRACRLLISNVLVLTSVVLGGVVSADAACPAIIRDHMTWINSDPERQVSFKLTSNQSHSSRPVDFHHYGQVGYAEGVLSTEPHGLIGLTWAQVSHRAPAFLPSQGFSVGQADNWLIALESRGLGYVQLLNQGEAKLPLENLQCSQDRFGTYLTGMLRRANGTSLVSMTLHKTQTTHEDTHNFGSLVIRWAGVIDNGEGDGAHGPHGNFHIRVFEDGSVEPGQRCRLKEARPLGPDEVLPGPSWLHTKGEWLDGDHKVFYNNFELFRWRSRDDSVVVVIWESDPGPFRTHDILFCERILRTTALGKTLIPSQVPAARDAQQNVRQRGVQWLKSVYAFGLHDGMPSVFLEVATVRHP